jgi:hypothetical protein
LIYTALFQIKCLRLPQSFEASHPFGFYVVQHEALSSESIVIFSGRFVNPLSADRYCVSYTLMSAALALMCWVNLCGVCWEYQKIYTVYFLIQKAGSIVLFRKSLARSAQECYYVRYNYGCLFLPPLFVCISVRQCHIRYSVLLVSNVNAPESVTAVCTGWQV